MTFIAFPVAPPRLAVSGFVDTVTRDSPLHLTSPLVRVFYNPVAAVPSVHVASALLVAGALAYATGVVAALVVCAPVAARRNRKGGRPTCGNPASPVTRMARRSS